MSLVIPAEVTALVKTSLTAAQLQPVIDRIEAEIIRLYGAHYVNSTTTVSETLRGGMKNLYLRRRGGSLSSVSETRLPTSTGEALTEADGDFVLWAGEGRLERLDPGAIWGYSVTVSYVPADDNHQRREVIIDLVRLEIERSAMKSESIAGEYSYTAPEWEAARGEILRRLGFPQI